MEFEHVGRHCAVSTCNQKDFLPFTCDYCKKMLCQEHKNYESHGCKGALHKDMTSIDCPICGKSVKFDKSQDVNLTWENHYNLQCTKQAANLNKPKPRCSSVGCNKILGPSNTFQCPKCHMKVCLSHRVPEDHDCNSIRAVMPTSRLLNYLENKDKKPKKLTETGLFKTHHNDNKKQKHSNHENTLKGSAHRRKQQNSTDYICPFCHTSFTDELKLLSHVQNSHQEIETVDVDSVTIDLTEEDSSDLNEVCPICNERFRDPISLISHCEVKHPDNNNSGSSSASAGNCLIS